MQIQINGETRSIETPLSVSALLAELGLEKEPVLVELDGVALHQRELATMQVAEGAKIELIRIVAGG